MREVTPETSPTETRAKASTDAVAAGSADPVPPSDEAGPQASARAADLVAGLLFVALGGFTLYAGRDLEFQAEFAAGPGFLPRILAIILIAVGGALAVKQFVRPTGGRVPLPSGAETVKIAATMGLVLLAVLFIEVLGFIVTAFLLVAGLLFGVERKFTITSLIVSVAVPVVFWTLFAVLLGARLPAGLISF
ncbi:tripartite tricarboxylate transporter TctB family protein [Blastococcus colisei]|uniref:Tripartite tricarboxylate transporter TctB family protein n=1 Tax=Blastococcus colisei TaxID=1564162 RepID=A0A543P1U1_9ACTN|nr:tripartite tricarboxylate transporter TctB family protein [Blastococcus colisei]TQN38052.1 tripartite tricarboxylate transporter TctB family protein [Blastococcus colisei]